MWDMRLLRNKLCLGIKHDGEKNKQVFIAQITLLNSPLDNAQTAACIQSFPLCPALGSLPKTRRAGDCLLSTGFVSAVKGNNGSQLFGASDRLTQGSRQLL